MKTYERRPAPTLVANPPLPRLGGATLQDRPPVWRPWRCRNWPSTAGEELAFTLELSMRAGSSGTKEP